MFYRLSCKICHLPSLYLSTDPGGRGVFKRLKELSILRHVNTGDGFRSITAICKRLRLLASEFDWDKVPWWSPVDRNHHRHFVSLLSLLPSHCLWFLSPVFLHHLLHQSQLLRELQPVFLTVLLSYISSKMVQQLVKYSTESKHV